MQDIFDVAIVGAGAAGLAAALELTSAGRSVVVLEARERAGGRAHTFVARGELPLDAGCGWVHSADRNVLVPLIEDAGLALEKRVGELGPPVWRSRLQRGGTEGVRRRLSKLSMRGSRRPRSRVSMRRRRTYFEPGDSWNSLIDAVSSYYNGTEYDRVSVLDYAAYVDTGHKLADEAGVWRGHRRIGGSIAPRFSCAVTAIDHRSVPVRLETATRLARRRGR